MDLNMVQLIGRVTQEPQYKETTGGTPVISFSLATNKTWKDKQGEEQKKVEYHNCIAWRGLATLIQKYVGKGQQLYIQGSLETRSWEDNTGKKHYRTEIVVDDMKFGQRPKDANDRSQNYTREREDDGPVDDAFFDDFN